MPLVPLVQLIYIAGLIGSPHQSELARVQAEFHDWSGAKLVFQRADLPPADYHDRMPSLASKRKLKAARIALHEARKYPRGYLGAVGVDAIGVFEACVSLDGDGYRPFEPDLGGYRYYGIWNGRNGIAAAYYTDGQLPLTLHHEVFHQVDGTVDGVTSYRPHFKADDARFRSAVDGTSRYSAPDISTADLAALKAISEGWVLKTTVSDYTSKSAGEDQAETARYFMSALPESLVQIAERPDLPGSQRILHVLDQLEHATPDGPDAQWFVDVALGRVQHEG